MTAITAITAQNTVGVELVAAVAAGDDRRPGRRGRRRHRRRRGQGRDARRRADDRRGGRRRSTWSTRRPVVVDPVMVSESGATLLDPNAKAALIERMLPRADRASPRTCPRRGRCPGSATGASALELGEALLALGAGRGGGHRRPRRGRRRPAGRARPARCGSRARATRTAPRTAPAAPTPRRWRRSWPAATSSPTPPAGRGRSPPRRSATACASSARGAGPVDVFGIARGAGGEARGHNRCR